VYPKLVDSDYITVAVILLAFGVAGVSPYTQN